MDIEARMVASHRNEPSPSVTTYFTVIEMIERKLK
jgi:hypothetical protein